jgi:hypothetical protein
MNRIFRIKRWRAYGIFMVLDTICVGMGMGVPVFCILLGFVVGWYIARVAVAQTEAVEDVVRKFLPHALATAAYTFVVMALLWGRWLVILFDPSTDYATLGIPMILVEPKASFIGWQALMILISPFMQVLTTLFGSHIALLAWLRRQTGV